MNVENGGRIELRLETSTSDSAEYEVHLQTSTHSYRARALVGASAAGKQVEFGAWSPDSEPPSWLTDDARAALKVALRTNQAEGRWPRRLTRWRPEPGA
jgi:hypothetical protein